MFLDIYTFIKITSYKPFNLKITRLVNKTVADHFFFKQTLRKVLRFEALDSSE